jgi:hypothetical protein
LVSKQEVFDCIKNGKKRLWTPRLQMLDDYATFGSTIRSDTGFKGYWNEGVQEVEGGYQSLNGARSPGGGASYVQMYSFIRHSDLPVIVTADSLIVMAIPGSDSSPLS